MGTGSILSFERSAEPQRMGTPPAMEIWPTQPCKCRTWPSSNVHSAGRQWQSASRNEVLGPGKPSGAVPGFRLAGGSDGCQMPHRRSWGAKRDDSSMVHESETVSLPQQALDRLRRAKHVAILTGAGVSAESGIATFRDKLVGFWEKFDPAELATPEAFRHDPALVWGWY